MHVATIRRRHGEREYVSTWCGATFARASGCARRRSRTSRSCRRRRSRRCGARWPGRRWSQPGGVRDRAFAAARARAGGAGDGAAAGAGAAARSRALAGARLCLAMICQRRDRARLEAGGDPRAVAVDARPRSSASASADEDELYRGDGLAACSARSGSRIGSPAATSSDGGARALRRLVLATSRAARCPLATARLLARRQARARCRSSTGCCCDRTGRPVAVEVFAGELPRRQDAARADRRSCRQRFGLETVVVVVRPRDGHQGQPRAAAASDGVGWITALKAPQIKKLVEHGALQLSLFDQPTWPRSPPTDYPGERLVVCRNPLVAAERARKRERAAGRDRARPRTRSSRARRPRGTPPRRRRRSALARRPGRSTLQGRQALRARDRRRHASPTRARPSRSRPRPRSTASTSCAPASPPTSSPAAEVVRSYKQLEQAERAFRTLKGPELEIRPIHHRLEDRVRAHVFLCMLAYYLTWHLRRAWTPLLFTDEHPARPPTPSPRPHRSAAAQHEGRRPNAPPTGEPCPHAHRACSPSSRTLTRNTIRLPGSNATFDKLTQPTTSSSTPSS